jgi:site-specific recombinase XerD
MGDLEEKGEADMVIARAISPELLEQPYHVWQQRTKKALTVIGGNQCARPRGMEVACALYLKSLYRRGLAESTIEGRYYYLKVFTEWRQKSGLNSLDMDKEDLRAFIGYCKKERGVGIRQLGYYCSRLKNLFSFLIEQGWAEENPLESFRISRGSSRVKQIISPEELSQLLHTAITTYRALPEHSWVRFSVFRDLVIMELLAATGLRVSELANLTVGDVDLEDDILYVQGKGSDLYVKRSRTTFIDLPELKADLSAYLDLRKGEKTEPLIVGKHHRAISPGGFDVIIKKWSAAAGLKRKLNCHLFRHTFCTRLVTSGADIYSVQKLMGHHAIESTLNFYLHLTPDEVKSDWRQHNPIGGR